MEVTVKRLVTAPGGTPSRVCKLDVRLSPDENQKLNDAAGAWGMSRSDVIRMALEVMLDHPVELANRLGGKNPSPGHER
jgi:hypothetical protein